ncbi:MAG: 4-phosphoerythronate dehydrogenase [Tannerella sp.]|nr:4-phosphoerythronate dehydrogenase [Tannerella sp.]
MKIVADDKIPFLKGVMEPYADIAYLPGSKISAIDVKDADAVFTRTRTKCNRELLEGSRVKLIVTATIGYDHIDTEYCEAAGIRWVNAPGCNSRSVHQYITAVLVTWAYRRKRNLKELTLGIIGAGNVGGKVAQAAEALGMRVLLNDPPRAEREGAAAFHSLPTLLAESDLVTCHTPLTKEGRYVTYHLSSEDFFNRMKPGAVYINSARGAVTDSHALKKAIQHRLSAFILDVWEGEPAIDPELLEKACIGTPHIAGYSSDGKANGTAVCVHEFGRFFGLDVLHDWYPESIPPPPMDTVFSLDGTGKSNEQIYYEAVTHTYPIWEDSNRLKQSPATFEEQRGGYWIRREFKNFTIRPIHVGPEIIASLQKIGFMIANP